MGGSQSTPATSRNAPSAAIGGESGSQVEFNTSTTTNNNSNKNGFTNFSNIDNTNQHQNLLGPHKPAKLVSPNINLPLPQDNFGAGEGNNTIKSAFLDDVKMIDSRNSQRMPPLIKNEVDKAIAKDAARICYETEKKMARCVQDKLYTVWKCQKERDEYYACTLKYKLDNDVKNLMRWKYNMGTFHGEIVARRRLMQALWKEYFPDREITHEWAND
jgi:hypothetical protein